jgi:hypothetical protein
MHRLLGEQQQDRAPDVAARRATSASSPAQEGLGAGAAASVRAWVVVAAPRTVWVRGALEGELDISHGSNDRSLLCL